jgi:hypothetical protein
VFQSVCITPTAASSGWSLEGHPTSGKLHLSFHTLLHLNTFLPRHDKIKNFMIGFSALFLLILMQKCFICFLCFYAARHAIRRFCLIWSYICNKVQKDTKRREKMQKLKCSFPDEGPSLLFVFFVMARLQRCMINFVTHP